MLAIFDDTANRLAPKVIGLYIALIAANLLVWVWAFTAFHSYPLLLATALIAYGFGLRHAIDADHIAAIDNTIEALGLVGDKFGLEGGLWVTADTTEARFGALGYLVVAIFVATWLVFFVIYRAMSYHKIPTLGHL